ncbi:SAG-related sequence [Besnoitia besnoiti]|uniref:SAG-related sequence n=1 Tax=Besnoitia besnoiti TaxID=94643 RepID=A0A2A9MCE7_BESBE|nr:SAG-related sequence [Besnoitia besnoiti]PFH33991.1 SAG-related sequence [Besnoitia besnoiti]
MVLAGSRRAGIAKALAITCLVAGQGISRAEPPPVDGHDVEINVAKAGALLKLKCDSELIFQPANEAEVSDDNDGQCTRSPPLDTLVPKAELKKPEGDKSAFTLSVPRLPSGSEAKTLCYNCIPMVSKEGLRSEGGCNIRIKVQSHDQAESVSSDLRGQRARILSITAGAVDAALAISSV